MKKIVFLTGTRADFGKLKSLINITLSSGNFEVHIFATGMHLNSRYGYTVDEIVKCGYPNIYRYINFNREEAMDHTLAKTIEGFSNFITEIKPDLIIIHGDRVEALAGAIVGALNNVLVAHVEGGEVSGTVDELIRHAVSKMSHSHFVSNESAKTRLIQMGEDEKSIFVIGSPDVDVMLSENLPGIDDVKKHYGISFDKYAMLIYHPVTTEIAQIEQNTKNLVEEVLNAVEKFVVIFPNNDLGSNIILNQYCRFDGNNRIKIFPSIRFEYFLVLLKYAGYILGNSSAGIREAPYYGVPTINIGTRQQNRVHHPDIIHCGYERSDIEAAIQKAKSIRVNKSKLFGSGNSDELFIRVISSPAFWKINQQKQFNDIAGLHV